MARLLVLIFAVVVVGVGVALGMLLLGDSPPVLGRLVSQVVDQGRPVDPEDSGKQLFTVKPGSSAADIGADLQERGLIRSALAFRATVEDEKAGSRLAAGDYELSPSMSTREIVQVLARGEVKRGLLATIPEGWRLEQIANRLESVGFASRDDFLRAARDPSRVPSFAIGETRPTSLEGYLFPETYEVRDRVSGEQAVALMVEMFRKRVGADLGVGAVEGSPTALPREPKTALTPHEVVTLASIVEREAQVPAERPRIAGVYLNRLEAGMPLQADPTVQYAVANKDLAAAASYGYWKQDLTVDDLELDSPYNTYVHDGLPPGPICNPGAASIKAVLAPEHSDYLYFVAKSDGSHLFAKTLDEHNANVRKVRSE